MRSQASPVVLRQRGKHSPAAGIVLAALVAMLILFQWLHFILALRIESAGREIQTKTAELQRIERHNDELRRQISIAGSQERMARRSSNMGYAAQRPVYLLVDQPLPPTSQSLPSIDQGLGRTKDSGQATFAGQVSGLTTEGHRGD